MFRFDVLNPNLGGGLGNEIGGGNLLEVSQIWEMREVEVAMASLEAAKLRKRWDKGLIGGVLGACEEAATAAARKRCRALAG